MAKDIRLRIATLAGLAIALAASRPLHSEWGEFAGGTLGDNRAARTAAAATPVLPEPAKLAPPAKPATPHAPAPTAELAVLAPRMLDPALTAGAFEPAAPRTPFTLARELQGELRRVGCYDGEAHGIWTPATRRAMAAFTDRINARLSTETPDAVMLALLQAHADRACGAGCPTGEGLDVGGRCVPAAILARKIVPPPAADAAAAWSGARDLAVGAINSPATRATPLLPDAAEPVAAPPAAARPRPPRPASASGSRPSAFGPQAFRHIERNSF